MPQQNNNGSSKLSAVATFASGMVIGIVVAPYVKDAIKKLFVL